MYRGRSSCDLPHQFERCNVDLHKFGRQFEALQGRLDQLYQGANTSLPLQPDLMPLAFRELGVASEELQVAIEQLVSQAEELATTRVQLEDQCQRYQDLFEFLPYAYLVTDPQGTIQEANRTAGTLLNISQQFLVGKPLDIFVSKSERCTFSTKIIQLQQSEGVQEWVLQMQPRQGQPFDAAVTIAPVRNPKNIVVSFRWILRDITERQQVLKILNNTNSDPSQNRPKHFYNKGEIICLKPHAIWVVHQGLVKLSTISERGEEILIGLVGSSMPFGSSMTSLPTYQATVLSKKVELVCIPLADIAASPHLSQALLPQMNQRLQQAESLLAIAGKRQVSERLHHLLLLLKQEFGQPVSQGTRLTIRLTHQDLAEACCTTRVTVTRLIGNLQQEGKIFFDSERHMILRDLD